MNLEIQPGDAEPNDHPPLVDKDGVTWIWDDADELDIPSYQRQIVKILPEGGALGSPVGLTWDEITAEYGPLREATADEAALVTWTFSR